MSEKQALYKISEELISKAAVAATLAVPGVNRMSDSLADNITKKIAGKETFPKGIRISKNHDVLTIDIFIIADYGIKIPQLAWDIQNSVKKSVDETTDYAINAINIHIDGVSLSKKFRSDL